MKKTLPKINSFIIIKTLLFSFVFSQGNSECYRAKSKLLKTIHLRCYSLSCIRCWQIYWSKIIGRL